MAARHRVVVVGGGPAAAEALLALREQAGDRVELELVAPNRELVVRAYEVLAPFHEGRQHRYPLEHVSADLDAGLVRDALMRVRPDERTIELVSGNELAYDSLIVAIGARQAPPLAGAAPFRGAQDAASLKELLMQAHSGRHQSVAFVVPAGHGWPLPLYELALQTSVWLADRGVSGVPLSVVSTETEPLAVFGPSVSAEVSRLLEAHGVEFVSAHAVRLHDGQLLIAGGSQLPVDLAIALPRVAGPRIEGLPHDQEGFLVVDELGRVPRVKDVYGAGDATTFPVKQGGLATQQADIAAATIAAALTGAVVPDGLRPVLRAVLYAGREKLYLTAELGEGLEQTSSVVRVPPWDGSSKLVGRHLAPYLASLDEARVVG